MKVGFIGTGRMGGAMVGRLLAAGHDVGVYNRTPDKAKPLADAGAKIVSSIADAARYGDVTYTMLADDTALEDVVFRQGLLGALPKGGIHVCAGTHGIPIIRRIKQAHADKGQALVAAPMMGRPELVSSGTAGVFASGQAEAVGKCKPLFEAMGKCGKALTWDCTNSELAKVKNLDTGVMTPVSFSATNHLAAPKLFLLKADPAAVTYKGVQ